VHIYIMLVDGEHAGPDRSICALIKMDAHALKFQMCKRVVFHERLSLVCLMCKKARGWRGTCCYR